MTTLAGRAFQCTTVLGEKNTVLIVFGIVGELTVRQRVDEFGLPVVGYKVFRDRN